MEADFIEKQAKILKETMAGRIDKLSIRQFTDEIETISNISWSESDEKASHKQMIAWDINLDPCGNLGRIATVVAITEKLFPSSRIKVAEVIKNRVAEFMLEIPFKERGNHYLEEILCLEDIQLILTIDGQQYDVKSNSLSHHPQIKEFRPWEGIAVWRTISELNNYDGIARINSLRHLKKLCPLRLIDYQLISAYAEVGKLDKAKKAAKKLLEKRPQARLYYVLYFLTKDRKYKDLLKDVYGPGMFNFITNSLLKAPQSA